jgi:ArsR family transcriptional regulator, lead/cadmium/zinc/bismuth-responsive transcriptional repressor
MPAVLDQTRAVDADRVERARRGVLSDVDAARLSRLLALLADPVRSQILFALVAVDEVCVGDLAVAVQINDDQASYALKLLRMTGLVQFRRDGRIVYYRLADGFPRQFLEHCLHELLSIATDTA